MPKLSVYKNSELMNVTVKYGDETISFNLYSEVRIAEDKIDHEIQTQPSKYGFLLLIHKKLLTQFELAKTRRKKVWAKAYLSAKENKSQSTGRLFNDDMAKAMADSDAKYIELSKLCIQLKDDADTIYSCVKAFEQRASLIQTLSSNLRKERI